MAVWSKVQGSPKSWSKLKQVCLNGTIQSAVRMCHTECRYEWRLLAYLGDIFLQGVHFSLSESFCDLEPAQWERNSVQLLHCWILNKCVCVYNLSIDPHGLVKSRETLSRRLLSWQVSLPPRPPMSLREGRTPDADCLAPSSAAWVPRALRGLEQPGGRTRQMDGWRWWAGVTGGDEVLLGFKLQRANTLTGSGNRTETSAQSLAAELRRAV